MMLNEIAMTSILGLLIQHDREGHSNLEWHEAPLSLRMR